MYTCFDVAQGFLSLADERKQGLTPLKLMKLVYIAHGFYLALKDKPLISNNIEAWQYGPVIPDLYYVTRLFGSGVIDKNVIDLLAEKQLEKEDKAFLEDVWRYYGQLSGIELSNRTHQEGTPWKECFKKGQNEPISNELISNHYKGLITPKQDNKK